MMRKLVWIWALTVGCLDLEEEYTLNPDGSGKVAVHWVGSPFSLGPDKGPEAKAKQILKEELTKCEGVDAWKGVSCTLRDDGKFDFKGTAYFKELSKLKLHNQGMSLLPLKSSKDADGNLVIVHEPQKKGGDSTSLSDEEAKKQLKEKRAEYQQAKPFLEPMLGQFKLSRQIYLPGEVGTLTNFQKGSSTSVRIGLEGKTLMKVLDDLVQDDGWMLQQIKKSDTKENSMPWDETVAEKLFGQKGSVRVITTGGLKAQFDYEQEVAAARTEWEEFAKELGMGPIGPPAKGGEFKSLKVGGVRYVHEANGERGLTPFGQSQAGLAVSFLGELPGSVLAMKGGRIEKAVADTGEDLLPEQQWERTVHWVNLGKDRATIWFDVNLKLPGQEAKGLKEVSGILSYVVGEKTKEIDLGIAEFKTGATGTAFGATINKIEDIQWQQGHQQLELRIELAKDMIASIVFQDESGNPLKLSEPSAWSTGEESTFTFTLEGKFPAKGRILANVYEDLKTYEIPFKVEEVDLLGRPMR